MHQFKPKMTGGLANEPMSISPEAHKEWKDSSGKHSVNAGIKEAPKSVTAREAIGMEKNEQSEKRGMKNKDPKPESKVNPFYNNKGNGGGGAKSPTGVNKTIDKQAQGKSSKRGP